MDISYYGNHGNSGNHGNHGNHAIPRYKDGGVGSGFKNISDQVFTNRLYQVLLLSRIILDTDAC